MAIFTKKFADADQYESWLEEASGSINVLSIVNAPRAVSPIDKPPRGPVTVTYQTRDKLFKPARSLVFKIFEMSVIAAGFFAGFLWLISKT